MSQKFMIYFKNLEHIHLLDTLSLNHYWNLRYDHVSELFDEPKTPFNSSEVMGESWEISEDAFFDFLQSLARRLHHDCIIGIYQTNQEMIGYLKLPNQKIVIYHGMTKEINSLREFIDHFEILLDEKVKERMQEWIEEIL